MFAADGLAASIALNAAALAEINAALGASTDRIQVRLSFTEDDNDNEESDYLAFFPGDNGDAGNHPSLVLGYVLSD